MGVKKLRQSHAPHSLRRWLPAGALLWVLSCGMSTEPPSLPSDHAAPFVPNGNADGAGRAGQPTGTNTPDQPEFGEPRAPFRNDDTQQGEEGEGTQLPEIPPPDDPPPQEPPPEEPPPEEPPPSNGCYSELYYPGVNLSDLKSGYSSNQWKPTMLETLDRRYPNGHWLLFEMQNDPYLPQYLWGSSFGDLMDSLGTMCHEETHGFDYDTALYSNNFAYYMGQDFIVTPPKVDTFGRGEILVYITDDKTKMYDETYLYGDMGTYDFIDLGDEINAYINGLACMTAVGDHVPYGTSSRDGAAAHLLYLQYYLKRARTTHPKVYAALQNSDDWQQFVRYAWARGLYWIDESQPFGNLGIDDVPILAKVDHPDNLAEIQLFTGHTADYVACHPEDVKLP